MKRLLVIALLAAGAALSQTAPKVDIARLDYGLAARALAPGV